VGEGDALGAGALARCPRPVTLALMDPPYPLVREPLGWQRVKAQAEKLVQCLADDGYLILRVPHPFFFDPPTGPGQTAEHQAPEPRRKKKTKRWNMQELEREEREKSRLARGKASPLPPPDNAETVDLTALTDEELDALDAADMAQLTIDALNAPVPVILDGALGPETHIYGTMAVHLYMRAR
jgi:hypothetical protein